MTDQTTTTFDDAFAHELGVESWTMYSIGMLLIALRVYDLPLPSLSRFADTT